MAKKRATRQGKSGALSKQKARPVVTVKATSSRTGITHSFVDTKVWEKLATDLSKAYQVDIQKHLLQGLPFWDSLNKSGGLPIAPAPYPNPIFFRLCSSVFDPLSIAGSLADGGRFNIGGAQQISGFTPSVSKAGCLYLASSVKTATAELPAEVKNRKFEQFQVSAKGVVCLWDLSLVIRHFSSLHPSLAQRVDASPMSAAWGSQKVPLESQLMAHYLRSLGGDGLFYQSTKDPGGINFAFFLLSDEEAHKKFSAVQI